MDYESLRQLVRMALKAKKDKHQVSTLFTGLATQEDVLRAIEEEFADLLAVHVVEPTRAADSPDGHLWYGGPENSDRPSLRWDHFVEQMKEAGRLEGELRRVDHDSTKILARVPSPHLDGDASGRGLALGYVQSGKTTNFMALAAKAADAGYRFIIVLSGVTNSLRNQTQSELEKYLSPFNNQLDWFWLTNLDRDFYSKHAPAVESVFNTSNNVAICVVKKNASKLDALVNWYGELSLAQRRELPVLVIDDECDQASINGLAAKQIQKNAALPKDEFEIRRTAINKLIVELISASVSPKSAYVGYSATPFSNLLLDPNDAEDLYPRDFVYSLEKGDGYFGPEEIFGRDPIDEADQSTGSLDMFNNIDPDNIELLGSAHSSKSDVEPELIPELRAAVLWLLVSSAIRHLRAGKQIWSTMLIHTSQRISCHASMASLISKFVDDLRAQPAGALREQLSENLNVELPKLIGNPNGGALPPSDQVIDKAVYLLESLEVVVDNSSSLDRLNYDTSDGAVPHPVIVIGGNTLSRGLVLHGLISTFFLRTARGYDALLQMGRWFGYRDGWADLPRIWMTLEMQESFRFLALVEEEIRQQIGMYSADRNPLDLGVRIRCHPKLQVTARGLGRVQRQIGLSGLRVETILFPRKDKKLLQANIDAGKSFVDAIVQDASTTVISERSLVRDVPVGKILEFLDHYSFSDDARVAERNVLKKYIEEIVGRSSASSAPELQQWDVYLYRLKGASPRLQSFTSGLSISKITRSARQTAELNPIADLHHLASQVDIATSIDSAALETYLNSKGKTKSQIKYEEWPILKRDAFGERGRGLLGLYLVDKDSIATTKNKRNLDAAEDILGLTFFFPLSSLSAGEINYVAPPPFVGNVDPEDLEAPVLDDISELIEEIESDDEVQSDDEDVEQSLPRPEEK